MENYQIEQRVQIDFAYQGNPPRVYAKQYDNNMRVVAVDLYNGGQPYTVPDGYSVNIRLDKRDGHHVYNPALFGTGNTVFVILTRQMLTSPGELAAEIEVVQVENTIKTASLIIACAPSAVPDDDIESSDEYKTVQEIAAEVEKAAKIVKDNEAAIKNIPNQIDDMTDLVEQAEAARDAAQASKTAAAGSASDAAAQAATASTKAEEASASAASSAASEDRARQYAEQAASVSTGYKGFFADPAALRAAYPTGENGWFATIGTTDTQWIWDSDTDEWVDSGSRIDLSEYPSWADLTGALLMPCNCIYESGTHVITHQSVKQIPGTRYTIVMVPTHDYTAGDAVTVAGTAVDVHYGMSNVDVQTGAWQAGKPVQVEVSGDKLYIQGGPPALDAPRRYGSKPIIATSYEGSTTVTGTPSPDAPATLTPVEPPEVPGAARQIGPLWSLPDGAKDTYDGATGELVRRVEKWELNGTEDYSHIYHDANEQYIRFRTLRKDMKNIGNTAYPVLCTHISNNKDVYTDNTIFVYGALKTISALYITIAKSVLYDATVNGFKTWLAAQAAAGTPVTILYELAEPVVERLIETAHVSTRATDILAPSWEGKTTVTGEPSPDNPATITGVPFSATATGPGGQTRSVDLDFTGYSLPDGTKDTYDGETGELVRRVGKMVLDGTEIWNYKDTIGKVYYTNLKHISHTRCNSISTHFKLNQITQNIGIEDYGFFSNDTYGTCYFNYDNGVGGLDNFKSWLAAQAAAGTPVTVYYELAEPIASYRKADITAFDGQTTVTGADAVEVIEGRVLRVGDIAPWEAKPFANAGAHNSIYRGMYLGDHVTAAQYAAIAAGTFDDLYIGDYWIINGRKYWCGHADYRLHCGDIELTKHHMLIVPDKSFYNGVMNGANVTTGAYYGSDMKTSGLAAALETIKQDFGADHILTHRQLLTNAVSNGMVSGWSWHDTQIDLMNEHMVYGSHAWGGESQNGYDTGVDKSQLALFQARPDLIANRENWWLRDVQSAAAFCRVNGNGNADSWGASNSLGVRPAFCIHGGEQ